MTDPVDVAVRRAFSDEKSRDPLDDTLYAAMHEHPNDLPNTDHKPVRRARWAALGAAVAVSVGAGGLGLAHANNNGQPSAYVAINPCRLADTRPDSPVGPHTGPIGADTAVTFTGHGDAPGDCNLPTNSTALELNVTAVQASQATFLTVYPTGSQRPTASHLNPAPGAAAAPNSVTAALGTDGQFDVYNRFGTVHTIIDVVGYYIPTTGGEGPAGPQGPAGPKGAIAEVTSRRNSHAFTFGDGETGLFTLISHCQPGEVLVGGGYDGDFQHVHDGDPNLIVMRSMPVNDLDVAPGEGEVPTGWQIDVRRKSDQYNAEIDVIAQCAEGA